MEASTSLLVSLFPSLQHLTMLSRAQLTHEYITPLMNLMVTWPITRSPLRIYMSSENIQGQIGAPLSSSFQQEVPPMWTRVVMTMIL
jgi:hypothetical protein